MEGLGTLSSHGNAYHTGDGFLPRDGTASPTADMPWGGYKITGLGAPTADNDAARKKYVDDADALAVLKSLFDATTLLYATDDNTPQPKTPAELMAILSGQAGAAFDWNSQNLTSIGTIGSGAITSSGDVDTSAALKADTISEHTAATGVTIDGTKIKDKVIYPDAAETTAWLTIVGNVLSLQGDTNDYISFTQATNLWAVKVGGADTINIDGTSLKVNQIDELSAASGVTIDGVVLKDGVVAIGDVAFDDATSDPTACSSVQAAADGTENSVARKDHKHSISHSITDNAVVTVDQADVAANDFAKFTANGLSGRSYEETLGDLSGQAGGAFDWNSQNLTSIGTIGSGAITSSAEVTGTTIEATGDTSAGDNSALGYTAAEGAILTGQGTTSDVAIKNDADTTVIWIPTGTTITKITSDIALKERADHESTPAAGGGYLWCKNTAPSTLIFTDDTGADTTLGAGGAGGGASTALDNLAAVAINTSLISDTDSTDDLGSAAAYWRYGYIDKLYLNATATISGATAGRHTVVGHIQTDGCITVKGASHSDNVWLNASAPAASWPLGAGGLVISPGAQTLTNDNTGFYGVQGTPSAYGTDGETGLYAAGLAFAVAVGALSADTTWTYADGARCGVNFVIAGAGKTTTVTAAHGLYVSAPSVVKPAGSVAITTLAGIHVCNPGTDADMAGSCTTMRGLYIEDCTNATNNYLLELGPTPYLRLLGSGSWTPAANETPLYLACDAAPNLNQVTIGAADSGGAGFRVLRVPN